MSTVQEIKKAAAELSAAEQAELAQWLTELADVGALSKEDWLKRWRQVVAHADVAIGSITWKREDLYER